MYSLVILAAMTTGPAAPQHWMCPATASNYGCAFWSGSGFYDGCGPAQYGWVDCWTKGFGAYPEAARGFCDDCARSFPRFYRPPACACAPGAAGCKQGGSHDWCGYDWPIGNQPAYYTSVPGCPPHLTAPPYAFYTERNPCCTGGHFAFDTGLIGHSTGVGYAGFGGYGNFGFYAAVPMMHPPTAADLPPFPRSEPRKSRAAPTTVPAPMPPLPGGAVPLPADAKKEEPEKGEQKKADPKKEKERLQDDRPAPATVVLSVPERATVTVEGHVLQSSGSDRMFRTPALAPGESYVYTVKATLYLGGRRETETREVVVTAGGTSRASFEELFAKVERAASRSVFGTGQ
jgi:uncharacterized protein (TIGR03000 family)